LEQASKNLKSIMDIKFQKLNPNASIPTKTHTFDACLDLVAVTKSYNKELSYIEYGTGLAIEMPSHCVGLVFPRSSISKTSLSLRNAVGVIDSEYRGEIKLRFGIDNASKVEYSLLNKIGQLMILELPNLEIQEVSKLSKTSRGKGGFGSTGI
jgi:dUTP pyrophosphatase